MPRIRIIRVRKPSLKTVTGVTKAKKQVKRKVGITTAMKPMRAPGNAERTVLRHAGYYSGPMRFFRFLGRIFGKK